MPDNAGFVHQWCREVGTTDTAIVSEVEMNFISPPVASSFPFDGGTNSAAVLLFVSL